MSPESARRIAEAVLGAERGPGAASELAHTRRVAATVVAQARCVAWLHDVVERSSITTEDLVLAGLTSAEAEAVRMLTRVSGEESDRAYLAHVAEIARARGTSGRLARLVKAADLADRINHPRPRRNGWTPPYAEALDLIGSAGAPSSADH